MDFVVWQTKWNPKWLRMMHLRPSPKKCFIQFLPDSNKHVIQTLLCITRIFLYKLLLLPIGEVVTVILFDKPYIIHPVLQSNNKNIAFMNKKLSLSVLNFFLNNFKLYVTCRPVSVVRKLNQWFMIEFRISFLHFFLHNFDLHQCWISST